MKLEIKKWDCGWKYIVNGNVSNNFHHIENAIEAGCKKMTKMLLKETFDFGRGSVPAHQHENGGGWVADTAHVDETAFVGPDARVYGNARVYNYVHVIDHAQVYGNAQLHNHVMVRDRARIHGTAIIEGVVHICDNVVFSTIRISQDGKITRT